MALQLLLWKNFKLKQRQWGKTLAEIIAPIVFFLILVAVRKSQDFMVKSPDCQFKPSAVASNGLGSALTTFCFLGVCQSEDTGYAQKSIFNNSELGQINEAISLYNQLYSDPVLTKYRKALDVFPSNWTDPAATNPLLFSSFFNNPNGLFTNVTANATQQGLVLNATLKVPVRLNVSAEPGLPALLGVAMAPVTGQLVCGLATATGGDPSTGGSDGWATIAALCNQSQFQANLQSQFNVTLLINQISSNASDSYTLVMNATDLPILGTFIGRVSRLSQTTTVLSKVTQLTNFSSDISSTISAVSKLVCGDGETTISGLFSRLSESAQALMQNASSLFSAYNPVFTTLLPPQAYCYNQRMLRLIMAEVQQLLSPLGMTQLPNLLFGEVLYYPNNNATQGNMQLVNSTYARLGLLSDLAKAWVNTESGRLANFLANGSQVDDLRKLFTMCLRVSGSAPNSLCQMGADFLSKNPSAKPQAMHWTALKVIVDAVMRRVYYYTACFKLNKLRGFDTEETMNNYSLYLIDEFKQFTNATKPYFLASIAFDTGGGATFEKYRLRMVSDKVDSTLNYKVTSTTWTPSPRNTYPSNFLYFTSFFIHLQEMLEQGITSRILGTNASLINYLRLFPSPCFIQDNFATVIQSFIPMIMTLAWIYSVTLLVNAIVYEKESRLKEMMKIMGLADWEHWLAWFITSGTIMLAATILMTILIKAGGIIVNSNGAIVFLLIFSFVVATICEAFFISVFFSNASVASAFAGVLFFVGYIPYTVVDRFIESMSTGALAASCLIPQIGFGLGCKYIGLWELANVGIQPSNINKTPLMDSSFTFGAVIAVLWFDAFMLMLLTWYIEKVFPGKYGVPKPFYFPFTRAYWCSSCAKIDAPVDNLGDVEMTGDPRHFEEEPKHLPIGAALRALTKIYKAEVLACKKTKDFTAVNSLTFNFYEGQVTSFLGHNGAGKSTTVSILTGLYTPTTGTAYIYGQDIRTQIDMIRKHLGFCPQHNVLFNQLTVEDHIYFYGMLKGLDKNTIGATIDNFVADVGLANKRLELSSNLSGGMKRKLSVAMAFVGDSRLIILDEPTAGVDPHARRSIWDVVGKFRAGRTILLTTHHMDEADILGDRICIIDKGRLVCSGSPMFLKKAFGHGYTLTLVTSKAPGQLLTFVQRSVPTAQLGECTTSEVAIKLPFSETEKFGELFKQLDSSRESLGIESYGIEDCSLEEIFLAVTEADREETVEKDASSVVNLRSSRSSFRKERQLEAAKATPSPEEDDKDLLDTKQSLDGSSRCATPSAVPVDMQKSRRNSLTEPPRLRYTDQPMRMQVRALLVKRITVVRRSKIGFVAEFLLPMFFILLSLGLQQITTTDGDNPPMQLAPWYMLGTRDPRAARTKNLFTFVETLPLSAGSAADADSLKSSFYNTTALGTRCVDTVADFANDKFPCLAATDPPAAWGVPPKNLPLDTSTCKCSYDKYPDSSKCVDWPSPASKKLQSADVFENYTQYNITNYIQSTVTQYYKLRFGGFSLFVNDTDPAGNYVRPSEVSAMKTNLGIQVANQTIYNFSIAFSAALDALNMAEPNSTAYLRAQSWFDNRGYVSGPAYLNIMHNAMLRSRLRPGAIERQYGVSGWTHPITLRSKYVENTIAANSLTSAITVVSIIFALSFIPASFVLFLIVERQTNAKHLQFVSGINPAIYWLINHLWNMINYLIPLIVLIIIFVAFKSDAFVSSETIGPFIVIMLLFGFANAPVMYPFSWVFSVPSKAFTLLACFNLGIGFVTTMAVAIVDMIATQNNDAQMQKTSDALKIVFLVFPHFCLGQALMELNYYYQFSVRLSSLAASYGVSTQTLASSYGNYQVYSNPWEPTRRYILCMLAQSIVYFGLILLMEYNFFCGKGSCSSAAYRCCNRDKYKRLMKQRDDDESDVKAECDRVLKSNDTSGDCLVIRELVKVFDTRTGPKAAVSGVTLGVAQRECFGFLGVNGAGKTTTFKMLTGDIDPTSGDAALNGHSILTEELEAHKQLGYCPQFDALLPLLTGRETLQLFARIRGIEEDQIPELITYISRMVGIVPHLDKLTEEYSGGNKRKLSCGIAFIGGPPIVFLDEPTAGMDPGARRFLWRCIQRMVAAGSCVILTSHSMEDCQALCHRLTIMVNGQLKCIGSPQHLKTKYGQGFTVYLRLARKPDDAQSEARQNPRMVAQPPAVAGKDALLTGDVLSLHERFTGELPEAQLKEEHGTLLQYQVSQEVSLSRIFNVVNRLKENGIVQDYSVNQTTLDQVFINFAKKQTDMTKEEKQGSKLLNSLKRQIRKQSASVGSVREQGTVSPRDLTNIGKLK